MTKNKHNDIEHLYVWEGEKFIEIDISKTSLEWVGIIGNYQVIWKGIPDGDNAVGKEKFPGVCFNNRDTNFLYWLSVFIYLFYFISSLKAQSLCVMYHNNCSLVGFCVAIVVWKVAFLEWEHWWLMIRKVDYISGSQPVARGPNVARQAFKSGPRPPKEFRK